MVEESQASVRLFRFDPVVDREPRYSKFEVPYEGRSVLDVLTYIYENLDSSIAFRWACRKTLCRSCALLVNGQPALSCTAPAESEMVIEPHPKFEIIKDLVVDFDRPKR